MLGFGSKGADEAFKPSGAAAGEIGLKRFRSKHLRPCTMANGEELRCLGAVGNKVITHQAKFRR